MSSTGSSTKELTGQALVDAFAVDLKKHLEKVRGRTVTDTKRNIVQMIVNGSPRLKHANIDNLERQLTLALSAGCRSHMGLRYQADPDGKTIMVALA